MTMPTGSGIGSSLSTDQERWAEALTIMRRHGPRAPLWVATQIGALAAAGEMAGVDRFRAIASRMEQLLVSRSAS